MNIPETLNFKISLLFRTTCKFSELRFCCNKTCILLAAELVAKESTNTDLENQVLKKSFWH